jgi:hypothetical protein
VSPSSETTQPPPLADRLCSKATPQLAALLFAAAPTYECAGLHLYLLVAPPLLSHVRAGASSRLQVHAHGV